MARERLEVADIFRAQGPAWRHARAGHLSLGQLKVMSAVETCRTAALGGHVAVCRNCDHHLIAYNSCRNRHCPKCQGAAAAAWLAAREAELLPVAYYHVVFTLPAPIADIAYQNKAAVYGILIKAAAETLITIAADPKHLGARIGLSAVLHTWGSALTRAKRRATRPPRALHRARWRDLTRWRALDLLPAGIFLARARALAIVPPAVSGAVDGGPRGWPPEVLR
jgi:hypothetical protein